jgi:ligand-binding SRPBCC domain-containing protein
MSRIALETRIAAPPERCFELSLSVELHLESTARTGERAVAGVTSGTLALGDRVTWEARHLGARRRLTVEITRYERPRSFRDEQVDGPFRRFVHDHRFEPVSDGTRMSDELELASLLGPLDRIVLVPHLRRLLRERNALIKHRAEAGERS